MNTALQGCKKEPEPYFITSHEHIDQINDLRNQPTLNLNSVKIVRRCSTTVANLLERGSNVDSDSDSDSDACIITADVDSSVMLRPLPSTTDDLIKYENDLVSGNIPYIKTVCSIFSNFIFYIG